MLKARTSPVWIASRPPDASLECRNLMSSASAKSGRKKFKPKKAKGGKKTEILLNDCTLNRTLAQDWPDQSPFSSSAKVLRYWNIRDIQNGSQKNQSKNLVMPPGPGPTSTTWHPAKDPPALATLSNSRGSRMKFWESRFWAWKICTMEGVTYICLPP